MALGSPRVIAEDTPSEIVRLTRTEFNALLDIVDTIVQAVADESSYADFKTNLGNNVDMTTVRKILANRERPAAHEPTY